MKKINLLFLLLFIPLVSSLQITSPNEINITKTAGENQQIELQIKNPHSFTIFNISIKEDIATMPKFDLEQGQQANITATITTDSNYDGKLTIIGEYETTIGSSNETEEIIVSYYNGIDKCNLNLIKGDSVKWINEDTDEIILREIDSNSNFATIPKGDSYTKTFNNPTNFKYEAIWVSPFTPICSINVMDDEGLVHNTEYDAEIQTNINIEYPPTTIETTFLQTEYEINHNQQLEDVFKIKNIGNKPAKNIELSGEWFEFDNNNINIPAGQSKNIGFKINPNIIRTNQTNQTYQKQIQIKGNFETINQTIEIFIPYKKLSYSENITEIDEELIKNFIKVFCENNLEECEEIFLGYFQSSGYYNNSLGDVDISKKSIIELQETIRRLSLKLNDIQREDQETKFLATSTLNKSQETSNKTLQILEENIKEDQELKETIQLLLGLFFGTLLISILGFIAIKQYKKTKANKYMGLSSGELS